MRLNAGPGETSSKKWRAIAVGVTTGTVFIFSPLIIVPAF